jgi:hypothetical protein
LEHEERQNDFLIRFPKNAICFNWSKFNPMGWTNVLIGFYGGQWGRVVQRFAHAPL